jgi:hypothetical protein
MLPLRSNAGEEVVAILAMLPFRSSEGAVEIRAMLPFLSSPGEGAAFRGSTVP